MKMKKMKKKMKTQFIGSFPWFRASAYKVFDTIVSVGRNIIRYYELYRYYYYYYYYYYSLLFNKLLVIVSLLLLIINIIMQPIHCTSNL